MVRAVTLGALALLAQSAAAFAWPTDDQARKICKAWALDRSDTRRRPYNPPPD